jgi:hypothetical protein
VRAVIGSGIPDCAIAASFPECESDWNTPNASVDSGWLAASSNAFAFAADR